MKGDLRGFDYALEPLRRKRGWQLEASQAALVRAEAELRRALEELAELRDAYEAERQQASRALLARSDPSAHRRGLGWLVSRRRSIAQAEEVAARLREERKAIVARCRVEQQELDVVERHRDECAAEFIRQSEARAYSEADREWLARQATHEGDGRSGPARGETP